MAPKFFRRSRVIGAERKGVRGDLKLVYTADRPAEDIEPTVERPAAMITSVRYYGDREGSTAAEAMTATSAALYELLMSVARPALQDKAEMPYDDRAEHRISFDDAMAFLRIDKASRLRGHMDALSTTWVSYDFLDLDAGFRRIGSRIQLMQCEEIVSTTTGERFISFSMHPSVAKVIRGDGAYAYLELGAFPEFSSKYTSRLYPRLALMAGREHRPPMTWTPEELAEELGWRFEGKLKFSNFANRVLKPILEDISQHVRRFSVLRSYVRADTRGKPVTKIVLTVGGATRAPAEYKKARSSRQTRRHVADIAAKAALDGTAHVPSDDILRRAATRLGKPMTAIMSLWTLAFAHADILDRIETEGVGAVFESWLQQQERQSDDDISFDDATVVRLIVAEGYGTGAVERLLLNDIRTFAWKGPDTKIVRVEWQQDGTTEQRDFEVAATEEDVALLVHRYHDIIDYEEYLL